ncbi:MAG TPA: DNA alkylation repair protein [Bacillota bacterium]|nr:DNA alkylation repair protein [Bacillota bacterium]
MNAQPTANDVVEGLETHASYADAQFLTRFFKTDEGQYGAGDQFIGVRVPQTRQVCKKYADLPLAETQKLLDSPVHEHRLAAVIILGNQYPKADPNGKQAIFDLYLKNVRKGRVNNWDLVDSSAEFIIGEHLMSGPHDLLFELAKSDSIWERRVAIISAFEFIKKGEADTMLKLAEVLLHDKEDLIQKAVGWMLRETGKRVSRELLLTFLDIHASTMPRTTLRYAVEHLPAEQKAHYMGLKAKNASV